MVTEELIFKVVSVLEVPIGYDVMVQTQLNALYERYNSVGIDAVIDLVDQYAAIEAQEQANAISRDSAIKKAAVVEWEVGMDMNFILSRKADIRRQLSNLLNLPNWSSSGSGVTRLYRS